MRRLPTPYGRRQFKNRKSTVSPSQAFHSNPLRSESGNDHSAWQLSEGENPRTNMEIEEGSATDGPQNESGLPPTVIWSTWHSAWCPICYLPWRDQQAPCQAQIAPLLHSGTGRFTSRA